MDSIIEINKKLNNEKNPDSATMLRRQVQSIDDNIDKIVWLKPAVGVNYAN